MLSNLNNIAVKTAFIACIESIILTTPLQPD